MIQPSKRALMPIKKPTDINEGSLAYGSLMLNGCSLCLGAIMKTLCLVMGRNGKAGCTIKFVLSISEI